MILGHVEFLNVKEHIVFLTVEISSWYRGAAQAIKELKS